MKVINSKNLTLKRLSSEDIEEVRVWRNLKSINQWMVFQGEITPSMQENWFNSLDENKQYYYIIETKGKKVGLVNIKNIENGSGESGIFIGDESYQNGMIGFEATVAMHDFGFNILKLSSITTYVFKSNRRARRLSEYLGYKKVNENDDGENQLWVLTKDVYESSLQSIRKFF